MILWLLQCHVGIGSRRSRSKRRWRWDIPKRISLVIVGQSSRIFWMHSSISRLRWSNDSRISWPRVWHIQRWPGLQIACTLAAIHPSQSCSSSKNSMSIWGNNDFHLITVVLTTGPILRSVLLMLTSIRSIVTNKAIRPGTISTGMRNPMKEATVRIAVGR